LIFPFPAPSQHSFGYVSGFPSLGASQTTPDRGRRKRREEIDDEGGSARAGLPAPAGPPQRTCFHVPENSEDQIDSEAVY
jgi:hypothetical protein